MDGEFRRFVRVLTDCHGVGFVVMVNHRDFHGNAASYDVGTTYDGGIMTCKNLTPGQVHAVPAWTWRSVMALIQMKYSTCKDVDSLVRSLLREGWRFHRGK